MIGALLIAVSIGTFAATANAECANACNGHGKCTSYDMCLCQRNWQANDCSERVCMFGLAHVDTPKGDLDGDGSISAAGLLVVDNAFAYPYGTTEQFPQMQDSDRKNLVDSAHYYMECSNKGKCDRTTGECQCYDGYDGVACQRASCPGYPNSCSGHGVCKTIEQLANDDNGNVYKLWDRDSTMGCSCDPGYYGPDCSQRKCKYGVDPLYLDDVSTVKYSIFDFATLTTATITGVTWTNNNNDEISDDEAKNHFFSNGEEVYSNGQWAIRFFDNHGEDWITDPIPGGATCDEVTSALYALPNKAITPSSLSCTRTDFLNGVENMFTQHNTFASYDSDYALGKIRHPYRILYRLALWEARQPNNQGEISDYTPLEVYTGSNDTNTINNRVGNPTKISGFIYRIKFLGNPGKIKSPEIEVYLDGKRPSLVSEGGKVITKVWTDGQQGEYNDYFADHCDGVTVRIAHDLDTFATGLKYRSSYLNGMSSTEVNILKKCLGDADGDTTNNAEVYNWDYGTKKYPHIVKLVRTVTTYTDGGYFAVLWWDTRAAAKALDSDNKGTFRLLNPFDTPDTFATDNYDVYTTKGTLALTTDKSEATFGFASKYIYTTNVTYDVNELNSTFATAYDGDISCEAHTSNANGFVYNCLNKTDLFTLLNWDAPWFNPPNINLYTAERIYTGNYQYSVEQRFRNTAQNNERRGKNHEMHYMTHFINTDIATNWGASVGNFTVAHTGAHAGTFNQFGKPTFFVYKFTPASASTYNYVAECSNRGLCDGDAGVCKCFPGYTDDACSTQSSLAV